MSDQLYLVLCTLMASLPRNRATGEIRECVNVVKVPADDTVLFVLVPGLLAVDGIITIPTVVRVRLCWTLCVNA